jgi:hypothetical protein
VADDPAIPEAGTQENIRSRRESRDGGAAVEAVLPLMIEAATRMGSAGMGFDDYRLRSGQRDGSGLVDPESGVNGGAGEDRGLE